jgi:hypothetical protein
MCSRAQRKRRTSENSVEAKFGIAPAQTAQDRRREAVAQVRGKPIRWSSEGGEGRIGLTMCRMYSRGGPEHILQKDCLCIPGCYFWG